MRKSKIFAFLTAFTMVASLFSASVSAAPNPVDDGLTFVAEYGGLDADSYHVFNFKLEDTNSKLVAVTGGKKYSGNAVDKIQLEIAFDEGIFNTSEIYVTKTSAISSGLVSVSNDAVSPVKYAWVQSDDTAALATLPTDYIVSVAVLTNGTYTEEEMLAGIKFNDDTNYQVINFDGTSKTRKYTSIYYVGVRKGSEDISTFLANTRIGAGSSEVAVESVTLDKSSVELDLNGTTTATLTATVTPDNATDKTVTWTTSDANVATVENGVVTAKKVGTATITAKAGDKSATCEVTVTDSTPVAPVIPAKGTVIVDAVDGKVVIYADSKNASEIGANATFEIEYTGTNEELKRADGTYKKAIKRTFGEILGGEIGEGKVTGKVHFGIKIPESVSEADRAFFTINVK